MVMEISVILPFIMCIAFPLFLTYLTDWDGDILLISGSLSLTVMIWAEALPTGTLIIAILMLVLAGYHAFFMDGE